MQTREDKKLEEVLVQLKLVTQEQLDLARNSSVRSGKSTEQAIIDMGLINRENLTKAKAVSIDVPYVDLTSYHIDLNILQNFSKELAKKYSAVPFSYSGGSLNVAMLDPNDVQVIEFIEKKSGMPVAPYLASAEGISNAINQYQDASGEVREVLKEMETALQPSIEIGKIAEVEEVGELTQDAPVTRALNTILEYAVKAKASDIHIESREKSIKVRYRIDGILHETMNLPVHIHAALISRIKILSNLKIDEHRIPQDGRFGIKVEDREVDIRVAISPTVFGEKAVLRLLDKSLGLITLEDMGIRGQAYRLIDVGAKRPHGMVLSTGPTGSGKSTTLYALLNKMNSTEVNIITLEDPVEYQIDGINQIQINTAVGLTFASGLRSILRQDPDIIMVGEIRDAETAELAIQSALTGHTVLSTLHTNNSAGVLPRLLDMGIEPFLISSTVDTVIGQRLVRRTCLKCKKPYEASPALVTAIKKSVGKYLPSKKDPNKVDVKGLGYENLPFEEDEKITLYKGKGCDDCRGTGYQDRIGIFEVFQVTAVMEKLLLTHATSTEIQDAAVKEGMITMREDGFLKALEGTTTVDEVISRIAEY
jgi:type IV pilus assembly protein PilB